MSISQTKRQAWAVVTETTPGVYAAPSSATDFVQCTQDGAELSFSKESIERNIFTGTIGQVQPRTGQTSASGTMGVEAKAHSTEGAAPEIDKLVLGALGSKHQLTSAVTTLTGNTASVLKVSDASLFNVDDIILVKEAGKFHVSPISAINTVADTITLLVPAATAFSDAVVIAKHTTYHVAESGHPSFSVSRYFNDSVVHKAIGAKVSSMSLEGFATGSIPTFKFGFEALNFGYGMETTPVTPSYNSQLPPIVLEAKLLMDGEEIEANELTLSIEDTIGYVGSINAANGRSSSSVTGRKITGSVNPYMRDDTAANMTKYKANTPFDIFAYASLPSATPGEFSGIVAIYLKHCVATEMSLADADGNLVENITFSVNRGAGTTDEMTIAFI